MIRWQIIALFDECFRSRVIKLWWVFHGSIPVVIVLEVVFICIKNFTNEINLIRCQIVTIFTTQNVAGFSVLNILSFHLSLSYWAIFIPYLSRLLAPWLQIDRVADLNANFFENQKISVSVENGRDDGAVPYLLWKLLEKSQLMIVSHLFFNIPSAELSQHFI